MRLGSLAGLVAPVMRLRAPAARAGARVAAAVVDWIGFVPIRDDLWLLAVWDGVFLMALAGEVGGLYLRRTVGDWGFPAGVLAALPIAFVAMRFGAKAHAALWLLLIGMVATAAAIVLPIMRP